MTNNTESHQLFIFFFIFYVCYLIFFLPPICVCDSVGEKNCLKLQVTAVDSQADVNKTVFNIAWVIIIGQSLSWRRKTYTKTSKLSWFYPFSLTAEIQSYILSNLNLIVHSCQYIW